MTTDPTAEPVYPPSWAQFLLEGTLPRRTAPDISGDLLEEYRERAAGSRRAANAWYVRQTLGFLFRLAGFFAVVVAIAGLTREITDVVLGPPANGDWSSRSALTTRTAVLTYLMAGLYAGWRTRRLTAAVLTAVTAHAIGYIAGIVGAIVLYFSVLRHDPVALNLFYVTGGWGETIGLPIVLVIPVTFLSILGGLAGKTIARPPSAECPHNLAKRTNAS